MSNKRSNLHDRRFESFRQFETLEERHLLSAAPLMITEFLASNNNGIVDGDGNSSDWIEIHNPTAEPVDLTGWFLSDDATQLDKWPFPSQSIAPNEHLVVFASGQSSDDFADRRNLHTNFRLSKDGEFLGLSFDDPNGERTLVQSFGDTYPPQFEDVSYGIGTSAIMSTLIADGETARTFVPTDNSVDNVWTNLDFDDSSWTSGPTGIGYENSPADYATLIRTQVPIGTDNAYVRIPFTVDDSQTINSLTLRMKYDDGFLAYLNGESTPIASANAPSSPSYTSVATGNHPDEQAVDFVDFDVTSFLGLLQDGPNVLAIHSLNQATSSDMLLVPELVMTEPSSTDLNFGYFTAPTPGSANTTGVTNPGPVIREVTENPGAISSDETLTITAEIASVATPIDSVTLNYRVMFGQEVSLPMRDDGIGSDDVAADGIFTAVIPASVAGPGEMLRWYVTANDADGAASRDPAFLDTEGNGQSPEYYGTVANDSFETSLPSFQWFTQSESASHTRSGARASAFYNGRFYDNIFVRQRGGATNSSQSQKFDFNSDNGLYVSEELGTVGEINLNGNGSDPSYLRQPMGFDAHTAAGGAASASFFTAMRLNGSFDRVGVWVEQVDQNFLERQGYDEDGDLYKLVQRSNLNPALSDTTTGVEKKTGDTSSIVTFAELVDGLELRTSAARQEFLRDNIDIAQVLNYMAVRSLQHQADDIRKNMYLYQDTEGDGLWRIYPWDLDWTFNVVGGHDNQDSQRTEHPFFGTQGYPTADGANQWNRLYNALFETVEIQEMYLRRLRTLMDQFFGGESGGTTWFADYVNTHFPDIDPHVNSSVTNGKNSLLNSIQDRRRELYQTYTNNIPGYSVVIPAEQIDRPRIDFGDLDFNPVSGNQNEEFIEIVNSNSFAADISGWKLTGGITHTFQPGTVIASNGMLYITPSVDDFRQRSVGASGGQSLFVQQWTSGHLSNFAEDVELRSADGSPVATLTYEGLPSLPQRFLRITEVDYHPSDSSAGEANLDDQNFEFIELTNTSETEPLDLSGVHFTSGVDFQFLAGTILEPGDQILVVADIAAFRSRYGDEPKIAGEFANDTALNNAGERIKLEDASGSTILDFSYDDELGWPTQADGAGMSLEPLRLAIDSAASTLFDTPSNWRASSPSPGRFGYAPQLLGDANGDGSVTFADFLILSTNFGKTDAVFAEGDFDGDEQIGFADFLILSSNFGRDQPARTT